MEEGSGFCDGGLAVVVMGISGAGKTTIGLELAEELKCSFYDADDFHTAHNKEMMKNGIALTDDNRQPWLEALQHLLRDHLVRSKLVVLACSALKRKYRDVLRSADSKFEPSTWSEPVKRIGHLEDKKTQAVTTHEPCRVIFVYLRGSYDLFMSRLEARYMEGKHYMPPSLLRSQLDSLEFDEEEAGVIPVDASMDSSTILMQIINILLYKTGFQFLPRAG